MQRDDLLMLLASAALGFPRLVNAQQKPTRVIGYLSATSPEITTQNVFRAGLGEMGYIEGKNVLADDVIE